MLQYAKRTGEPSLTAKIQQRTGVTFILIHPVQILLLFPLNKKISKLILIFIPTNIVHIIVHIIQIKIFLIFIQTYCIIHFPIQITKI